MTSSKTTPISKAKSTTCQSMATNSKATRM
jgi:hypothetical protein